MRNHSSLASVTLAVFLFSALPSKAARIALFDRLAGTWDVTYDIYNKDGSVRPYHGQVIYTRILDGKALQEIWTSDIHNKIPQPFSTTLGFYDAQHEQWIAVSVMPPKACASVVSGAEVNGSIVLTGRDPDGTIQRWTIDNVQEDSFLYHFDSSNDEGKTWRALGINHMQRHRS